MQFSPQSSKSIQKVQDLALKILESSPSLVKEFSNDSIIKQGIKQTLPQIIPFSRSPTIVGDSSPENHRNTVLNVQPMTNFQKQTAIHQEWQKRYNELDSKYRKVQLDFVTYKNDVKRKEIRYVQREEAFKKLINELETRLKGYISPEDSEKMKEIQELHNNVLQKIENIQDHTSKQFFDQEKQIIKFFDNKIKEIKHEYESERIKHREKNENFNSREESLVAEIEWVKNIAQKIDNENQVLTKRFQNLKANQPSKSEDMRMNKQIMSLKRKNAILQTQVQRYEEIIQQFSKEKQFSLTSETPDFLETPTDHTANSTNTNILISPLDLSPPITILDTGSEIYSNRLPLNSKPRNSHSEVKTHRVDIYSQPSNSNGSFEAAIQSLKATLQKEKKQKQYFKTAYLKELEGKSELEEIVKNCIQEVRASFQRIKNEKISPRKKHNQGNTENPETKILLSKLINDERILTLIYDKTFHNKKKLMELSPGLLSLD